METFLERYKNIMVLSVVLLAQFLGLAVQIRTPAAKGQDGKGVRLLRYWVVAMMSPPEKVMSHTGHGVRGFWSNYLDLRDARAKNQKLQDQIDQLRLEQASLLEDARQGQRLQALLGFRQKYIYDTVPAQVIGTGGSDQSRILTIDKGSKDGLKRDQAVITPDGIVGKLVEVFPHTSQVLEINDQTSGAGVLLVKTRLRGVLRGNAYGEPQIINVLPDERVKPGEQVITSGGDQIFPRGLAVGAVEKVAPDPDREPYVDIVLKPAANLQHLDEVLVITGTSNDLSPDAKRDLARSQAVGGEAAELQRASDVLAEKLPGLINPDAPAAADGVKGATADDDFHPVPQPLPALRPDRYSPGAAPPAAEMTPGKTFQIDQQTVQPPVRHVPKKTEDGTPANGTGTAKPEAQAAPEGLIIPGTATDSSHPLRNPEKAAAARSTPATLSPVTGAVSTAGAGNPPQERP